ncbi:MAG: insulinase family protein [Cellulosilyticaceae bacterium]
MDWIKNESYHGFRLIDETQLPELKGTGRIFQHEHSGVRLIHIACDDTNKVFTMTFKTPPTDNTGVAHIVEHTVCCASENYPLKDTFVEMDKGSLNTALNACTYKDMTMYYCASQNEKDLHNLMTVYMDLVCHPLMLHNPLLFRQEGWHYAIEDAKDPITYNGIVYNEMKGEYAEPTALLDYEIHQALFPDTCYRYDSGGVPESIVTLSQEAFEAFYRKHYQPQNATLYLYGDGDLLKQLADLDDNYLKNLSKGEAEIEIPRQQPPEAPLAIKRYYGASKEQGDQRAIFALSFVVEDVIKSKERLAFQILEHMLLKSAASPLAEAIVSRQMLGKVLEEVGYDPGKKQPTFSFVLSGAKEGKGKAFEKAVRQELQRLVTEGIPKDLLEAALHTVIFSLHEGESQSEPKGVLYSEDVQMSMLYGGEPFAHLTYTKDLEALVAEAQTGYFERLIKKYFLDNTHRVLVELEPKAQLLGEKERAQQKLLANYKKSLSPRQLEELLAMNQALDAMQEEENDKCQLAKLPSLKKEDLCRKTAPIRLEEGALSGQKVVWQHEKTQGIAYIHLLFDATCIKQEHIPYLGMLANVLTYMSTKNYGYSELENAINSQTGGINCSVNGYSHCLYTDRYQPFFKISSKVLVRDYTKLLSLLREITCEGVFTDRDKLKELLSYVHYEMERSFVGAPEYRATRRLYSYYSEAAVYEDYVSGLTYYRQLEHILKDFERYYEEVAHTLQAIYETVMTRDNLRCYITCEGEQKERLEKQLALWIAGLPTRKHVSRSYMLKAEGINEAFATDNEVQAIAMGYNFKKHGFAYHAGLHVLTHIINSTYLWDKVRLQGGAYGCEIAVGRDGNVVVCSYCDPELEVTLDVFKGIPAFIERLEVEEEELLKYMIGTIGSIDYPMTMEQKSERAIVIDLCGLSEERLQKERLEILEITPEQIKGFAQWFEPLVKEAYLCVIGSEQRLKKNKDLFEKVITL